MEENVIEINVGTMINDDVDVKNIIYMKKMIFGILLHAVAKIINIQQELLTIQYLPGMKLQTWTLQLSRLAKLFLKNISTAKK